MKKKLLMNYIMDDSYRPVHRYWWDESSMDNYLDVSDKRILDDERVVKFNNAEKLSPYFKWIKKKNKIKYGNVNRNKT